MRWHWIDRFEEFVSGVRAVSIKNVTMAEEHLHGYWPGFPMMPNSLIIEGLAQTGGLLVGEHNQFIESVVLAKVSKAIFHNIVRPGDSLRITAIAADIREDGGIINGEVHCDGNLVAEINLIFACLRGEMADIDQFYPIDFINLLRALDMYKIGVTANGDPITPPQFMLDAEKFLEQSV